MGDKNKGAPIAAFVRIKSKMQSCITENGMGKKAKGINFLLIPHRLCMRNVKILLCNKKQMKHNKKSKK